MSSPPFPQSSPADAGLDRELMLVASVVVLGAIMSILDVTVVNVAINTLAREFDTTLPIQSVATGYTLALVVVAFVIATPLLPKQKPAPVEDPAAEGAAPAPVLVH
jgi:hypothetical protein